MQFIAEVIKREIAEMGIPSPNRHMVGPFPTWEIAQAWMTTKVKDYDIVLIHNLYDPTESIEDREIDSDYL